LQVNGETITDARGKAKACRDHLQQQWERRDVQQANSFPWHCPRLDPTQTASLVKPITQEEVVDAITHSPNGKAPGPDGIPSEFYKHFSNALVMPMTRMFNDILLTGKCAPISWSQSKCILIPKKKQGLDNLANWRPITLENCDLKIFSRILANRTQNILDTLIGNEQTGFIAGCHIHHSALNIDTVLHSRQKGSYLLSLDWSKAYDKVNHKWLTYCLQTFGFPAEYIRTIEDLFYSRNASVAVDNNEEIVQCKQGVPQGDPIAPLLFVLALEPLLAAARVEIAGVETPKGTLTNAAFADDSTFFIQDDRNVMKLIDLLQQYSDVSGAIVNWHKSALTPLSAHPPIQTTPFTLTPIAQPPPTLGFTFPLNNFNNTNTWESKISVMNQKMTELGCRKSLTYAGRVLICKSLILSKAWYVATLIAPSPAQTKTIQSMVWKFIFGKSCIHPSRPIALLPKKCGGINAPDVQREVQTYAAHLYHQAIINQDTPWGHHLLTKVTTINNAIPAHAFLIEARKSPGRRGWRAQSMDHTLVNALIAWHYIQKHSGGVIEEDWTHKQIKYIIKPKCITPVTPPKLVRQPQLSTLRFRWKQLWRTEIPPKVREVLWRAAYNSLPSRNRLRYFTELDQNCTLCGNYEDGPHMLRWCPEVKPLFFSLYGLCLDRPERIANLIYGIAQYAIYLDNVYTRLHSLIRSPTTIKSRFKGLMTHHFNISRPDIQQGWPSGEEIDQSLSLWVS
jgi:hypothetical protein